MSTKTKTKQHTLTDWSVHQWIGVDNYVCRDHSSPPVGITSWWMIVQGHSSSLLGPGPLGPKNGFYPFGKKTSKAMPGQMKQVQTL